MKTRRVMAIVAAVLTGCAQIVHAEDSQLVVERIDDDTFLVKEGFLYQRDWESSTPPRLTVSDVKGGLLFMEGTSGFTLGGVNLADSVGARWIFSKADITFRNGDYKYTSKYNGATIEFRKDGVLLKGFTYQPNVAEPKKEFPSRPVAAGGSAVVREMSPLDTESRRMVEALLESGKRATQQKQTKKAIGDFEEALRLDPNRHLIWSMMAETLTAEGRFNDAEAGYKKAISLAPNVAAYRDNHALLLARMGRVAEAREELTTAAALDAPNSARYHFNLGAILLNVLGDRKVAGEAFRTAAAADPNFADARFQYGIYLVEEQRTDEARRELEAYLRLQPTGPKSSSASRILLTLRTTSVRESPAAEPPRVKEPEELGRVSERAHKPTASGTVPRGGPGVDTSELEISNELKARVAPQELWGTKGIAVVVGKITISSSIRSRQRLDTKLAQALRSAADQLADKASADAMAMALDKKSKSGKFRIDTGAKELKLAVTLEGGEYRAHRGSGGGFVIETVRAPIFLPSGISSSESGQVVPLLGTEIVLYHGRVRITCVERCRFAPTESGPEGATQTDTQSQQGATRVDTRIQPCDALTAEGRLNDAEICYRNAISRQPKSAPYRNNYALLLARMGRVAEARQELAAAARLDPPNSARYHFNLGAVLLNVPGDRKAAGEAFRAAASADPNFADARFHYGVYLVEEQLPSEARRELEAYLRLQPKGPNSSSARQILSALPIPSGQMTPPKEMLGAAARELRGTNLTAGNVQKALSREEILTKPAYTSCRIRQKETKPKNGQSFVNDVRNVQVEVPYKYKHLTEGAVTLGGWSLTVRQAVFAEGDLYDNRMMVEVEGIVYTLELEAYGDAIHIGGSGGALIGVGSRLDFDNEDWVEFLGGTYRKGGVKITGDGLHFLAGTEQLREGKISVVGEGGGREVPAVEQSGATQNRRAGSAAGVADSLTLTITPRWLGGRLLLNKAQAVGQTNEATGERTLTLYVLTGEPAHTHLRERNGEIDLGVAYQNGRNDLGMPTMSLEAQTASPLDLESSGLRKFMGDELFDALRDAGKLDGNLLVQSLEFYAVRFTKEGSGDQVQFAVTAWVPVFLIAKLLAAPPLVPKTSVVGERGGRMSPAPEPARPRQPGELAKEFERLRANDSLSYSMESARVLARVSGKFAMLLEVTRGMGGRNIDVIGNPFASETEEGYREILKDIQAAGEKAGLTTELICTATLRDGGWRNSSASDLSASAAKPSSRRASRKRKPLRSYFA